MDCLKSKYERREEAMYVMRKMVMQLLSCREDRREGFAVVVLGSLTFGT